MNWRVSPVEDGNFLNGLADADNAAIIGYSMGGYGAIISAGGGVTQAAVDLCWGGPHGTLGVHLSGSDSHNALPDPRIKTIVAFGPWGMVRNFWDEETLKGISKIRRCSSPARSTMSRATRRACAPSGRVQPAPTARC
jgi:hypothetical protein